MTRSFSTRSLVSFFAICLAVVTLLTGSSASAGEGIGSIGGNVVESAATKGPAKFMTKSEGALRTPRMQLDDQVLRQFDYIRTIA